ncbi:hypothetical protein [Aeromonas media]|uniref:hypothetical protein n=1 Tax=Aeromonas media TaxID=651 RepID=UPI000FBDF782
MKLMLNVKERKSTYAELKTEYLYVLIPFMLLIAVKLYISSWQEIIMSPDWSLASCLIFGQITSKVSKAIARTKCNTSEEYFGWYTAKRFLLVLVSAAFYFGMLSKPTFELGVCQLFIFILASYFHFKDGFTTKLLQQNS